MFQILSSFITSEQKIEPPLSIFKPSELDLPGMPYLFASKLCTLPSFKGMRNPFTGLVANRISCLRCGFKSALRHETFDNLSLAIKQSVNLN